MALFGLTRLKLEEWKAKFLSINPEKREENKERRFIRRAVNLEPKLVEIGNKLHEDVANIGSLERIHKDFHKELDLLKKEEQDILEAVRRQELVEALRIRAIAELMNPNNPKNFINVEINLFNKENEKLAAEKKPFLPQSQLQERLNDLRNRLLKIVKLLEDEVNFELNELYWLEKNQTMPPGLKNFARMDIGALGNDMKYVVYHERVESRKKKRLEKRLEHETHIKEHEDILKQIDEYIEENYKFEKLAAREMSDLVLAMVYFYEKVHQQKKGIETLKAEDFPSTIAEDMLKAIDNVVHEVQTRLEEDVDRARAILQQTQRKIPAMENSTEAAIRKFKKKT
ncbi:MAG: hypothetical protein V1725_03195 [archaeon]